MIKEIVSGLDFSDCAELALALMVVAFAMVTYGAMRLSRAAADRCASIPLFDDQVQDQ